MKYATDTIIDLPREKVISLFDNTKNLFNWQEGLKSFDHIEGEPGQEGARSRLVYESRKGDLEITETITRRNLPDEFHGVYESKGVYNEIYNYFIETAPDQTTWETVSIFRFRGLMAVMAPIMKSVFISTTLLNMERFKVFAEQTNNQPEKE